MDDISRRSLWEEELKLLKITYDDAMDIAKDTTVLVVPSPDINI